MATCSYPNAQTSSISFSDFPEDVHLCILSFLTPSDISSFSCTSKRFVSLCHTDSKLWYAMCDRKWGSKTNINKWGSGKVGYKILYKTLNEYENLIGFWRRSGETNSNISGRLQLVFFEWGRSCVTGSWVSPSKDDTYNVIKSPFIWMSLSPEGEALNYLNPDYRAGLSGSLDASEKDLIYVSVSFIGKGHVVVEESREIGIWVNSGSPETIKAWNSGYRRNGSVEDLNGVGVENMTGAEIGSPPERLMSEIYQYFANRSRPGTSGERAWRRQRRREKEKLGKRKWEAEHFAKIVDCSPTPSRPLQGLWKGICEDAGLDFYLIRYDDIGGIACRGVGDSSKASSAYAPLFWTSNATFVEPPFSLEEELLYRTRIHFRLPLAAANDMCEEQLPSTKNEVVSRMMYINSSYDLVLPDFAGTSADPRHVEGRIWQYPDGTFGFGFLRDNFVVHLKHVVQNSCLLDAVELCSG
ncbi:hypothetical protein Nepgr_018303 [Nepenthes gracilis]|uniref:F-box protein n=1 Tax=Nepenthes gracilis TaxID=150966 RepID=A0AAD3SSP2_NEPGR|nr:hypothetical protein Nepgr_018303 [Nepenthes gracilis]